MKFAAFTTVAASAGEATNSEEMLNNLRQQTILAEELGFETIWLGEHHFGPYGVGDLPNPILLGADLAARTSRIRIGQMANIAPHWHPIRLAEDLAILDNMTGGRVEVGFGRGIWPYEGPQFHPNADPRKDSENRELFQETVEIVREIWANEYFSHHGANYSFPADDTVFSHPRYPSNPAWQEGDRVTKLRVTPKPYQKPHPPLWMTVSTDRSVTTAAELGLKACYWQPPALRIKQRMELYAQVRTELEGRPFALGEDQGVMRSTYVASSMEEARRDAEEGIMSSFIFNDPFRGRQVFTNPDEVLDPSMNLDWDFLEPRTLLVGSPENVVEKIQELQEVCHLGYLLVEFTHMGIPLSKTLKNLETFATKVMPRLPVTAEARKEETPVLLTPRTQLLAQGRRRRGTATRARAASSVLGGPSHGTFAAVRGSSIKDAPVDSHIGHDGNHSDRRPSPCRAV